MSLQDRISAVQTGLNLGGIYDFEDYELLDIVQEVDKVLLMDSFVEKLAEERHNATHSRNPCKCCTWERLTADHKEHRISEMRTALQKALGI